jgi:membrane protease YdiL (CAAX protease family)
MTASEIPITGRAFVRAILLSIAIAIAIGTIAYFALRFTPLAPATRLHLTVLLVYCSLFAGLCVPFRPATAPPIAFRPSGIRKALLATGVWIATLGVIVLAYFCLGFAFGNPHSIAEQITARATDAQRLQGAPAAAWTIAIVRGCFIVPLFEETFFRGLLLSWLRRHLRFELAVFIMALLFTLEHGSLLVAPYTFIFAVAAAWVRERTGSLFNCVLMHSLNNTLLLFVGLSFYGR